MSVVQQTPWNSCHQNNTRADQLLQPTRTPVHHLHQQEVTVTNSSRTLKSGPPLMRKLGIYESIPVSGTKLMLGLRVSFISSHSTADKLFPVNPSAITGPPKMSLLLEAKSMKALIIKPRLILVVHMDDLGWNKTSHQLQQILIQNLNRIVSRPNVTPGQILYCTTNCFPINMMFKENVPTKTQVWNSLGYRND